MDLKLKAVLPTEMVKRIWIDIKMRMYINFSEFYYRKVNLNGPYNKHCYLITQFNQDNTTNCPGGIIDGYCSLFSNGTEWIYSTAQSLTFCLRGTPLSIAGALLNFLAWFEISHRWKIKKVGFQKVNNCFPNRKFGDFLESIT